MHLFGQPGSALLDSQRLRLLGLGILGGLRSGLCKALRLRRLNRSRLLASELLLLRQLRILLSRELLLSTELLLLRLSGLLSSELLLLRLNGLLSTELLLLGLGLVDAGRRLRRRRHRGEREKRRHRGRGDRRGRRELKAHFHWCVQELKLKLCAG